MSKLNLNKYQEIELVRMLDLNTEENILITDRTPGETDKLKRFIDEHKLDAVSIRTVSPHGKVKTPHFPVVDRADIPYIIHDVLNMNLYAIVATPIDPKDALLAGAILKNHNKYSIELARGPCTVRRVTHDNIIDIKFEWLVGINTPLSAVLPPECVEGDFFMLLAMMRECVLIPFTKCVIELSYYSVTVGYKKECVIIWGIGSDGSQESVQEIESFYHSKHI